MPLRASDIHAAGIWPSALAALGIDLPMKGGKYVHGPCPACGGRDRFRFTNFRGRGDFICNKCGSGDGFTLLQKVHGWPFRETLKRVADAAGLNGAAARKAACAAHSAPEDAPATPSRRVRDLLRTSCDPCDVADVRDYLASRCLWPLPAGTGLRAHAMADDYGEHLGKYPALIGIVTDISGESVTAHVTFIQQGRKRPEVPRKLLSPMTGRDGCAVRLARHNGALGIAEGIETAISATVLHGVPTWAACNAVMLEKFTPPTDVSELHVFADRDAPGLEAAGRLMERLQGKVRMCLRVPPDGQKDFNDVLMGRASQ